MVFPDVQLLATVLFLPGSAGICQICRQGGGSNLAIFSLVIYGVMGPLIK